MNQHIPVSLKIVAWLFILSGISAVIEIIASLANNHFKINFGVLGIFIGVGLLKLSPGWRICGLVFIWLGLILGPIIFLILITAAGPLDLNVFGQKVGHASKAVMILVAMVFYALLIWQYRVLTRSDVRALFDKHNKAAVTL